MPPARQKCAYFGCENARRECRKSFFTFPTKNIDQCKQWVKNSGNVRLRALSSEQLSNKYLCEDHFEPTSYHLNSVRKLLYEGAVPVHYGEKITIKGEDFT